MPFERAAVCQEGAGSRADRARCEPRDCVAVEDLACLAVMEMELV